MQIDLLERPDFARSDQIMVARIRIDDTATARRYVIKHAIVERLQRYRDGAWLCELAQVCQLIGGSDLTGGDDVLHIADDERDHGQRLSHASGLCRHADLENLRFNRVKARKKPV